jgi:hypothetical protein
LRVLRRQRELPSGLHSMLLPQRTHFTESEREGVQGGREAGTRAPETDSGHKLGA